MKNNNAKFKTFELYTIALHFSFCILRLSVHEKVKSLIK